jgi:hypothetical protein
VPGRVGQRLGHHEVGGRLDRHRGAGPGLEVGRLDADVQAAAGRERADRAGQPSVGQDRRVDPAHHVPQFGQGLLGVLLGLVE